MPETMRMIGTYFLGFAIVWGAILAACGVAGLIARRRHDWDQALSRELLAGRRSSGQRAHAGDLALRAEPSASD